MSFGKDIYFEYTKAAKIQMPVVPAQIMNGHENGINTIDISDQLQTPYPATSPSCLVSFINLNANQSVDCCNQAATHVFVLISGSVTISSEDDELTLEAWDCVTFPFSEKITITASEDSHVYWVNDVPMLNYLGATPTTKTIQPTHYSKEAIMSMVSLYNSETGAKNRNRNGVLLANESCPVTKTLTPTLWSLFNDLGAHNTQLPHKHNSVALDLVLYAPNAKKGSVYTLISEEIDENGQHINPIRFDWATGGAFITPPGLWHSHINDTDEDAIVFPVQDAGLQTYLRTLFIEFYTPKT